MANDWRMFDIFTTNRSIFRQCWMFLSEKLKTHSVPKENIDVQETKTKQPALVLNWDRSAN